MDIRFEGKNILISGATGHLGIQLAEDYCNSGAHMLLLIDSPDREKQLKEMEKRFEGRVATKTYTADFRKLEDISRAVEDINGEGIMVDILVNNAGLNILRKTNEMDEEVWDMVLDVNLKGSFFLTKLIGQASLINRRGNVVFISSQHGVVGNIMRTAYCSSKTGIIGLVRALTADWSVFDVRINAVSPTYIMHKDNEEYLMSPREKRNMLNKIPLHRYASLNDVSNAVLFISSDRASMITGHNLVVDGGYTCL
ncbi:MAG: SDR family oxidoreductase [Clostridia bacterium]|nr:SDR family oxidoreductase [Clostridia bacterium]